MKCDELKVYNAKTTISIYNNHDYYLKMQVDYAIAELKAENERLKDKLRHYPMMAALLEADKKELRATQRALWLARAERAVAEQTIDEWSRYKEKHPCGSWRADPFDYWVMAWIYVEKLCRKKSKEYK